MPNASPHVSPGLLALVSAVLAASLTTWLWIIRRWQTGRPLLEFEARRSVPWGLADAAFILGGWFVLQVVIFEMGRQMLGLEPFSPTAPQSPKSLRFLLSGTLIAGLTIGVLGPLWLCMARGARASDLGLSLRRLPGDLWLGLVAFAAIVVPVYAIQAVLVQFWPSHHPIVQGLQESHDRTTMILAVLTAAVAAPIVEEFLFRLVLQGGLEAVEIRAVTTRPLEEPPPAPPLDVGNEAEIANAYASPRAADCVAPAEAAAAELLAVSAADIAAGASRSLRVWGLPVGVWPILLTSALFALMHAQHGPDPIPLFVLSVVLGYLYRQTHRLLPSIVVHMLLNSCSLAAFLLQMSGGPQP